MMSSMFGKLIDLENLVQVLNCINIMFLILIWYRKRTIYNGFSQYFWYTLIILVLIFLVNVKRPTKCVKISFIPCQITVNIKTTTVYHRASCNLEKTSDKLAFNCSCSIEMSMLIDVYVHSINVLGMRTRLQKVSF